MTTRPMRWRLSSLGLFPSSVANRGLELSEERKINTFITDYIDSRFIIYNSARYVSFVQCRR